MSRITRSSLVENTTGNVGLGLSVEMAYHLLLKALQGVLLHLVLVEVQSSDIIS